MARCSAYTRLQGVTNIDHSLLDQLLLFSDNNGDYWLTEPLSVLLVGSAGVTDQSKGLQSSLNRHFAFHFILFT